MPRMDDVEIRDWDAYEPAVAAGQVATEEALSKLTHAVVDLRRRPRVGDIETVAPPIVSPG